MLETGWPQGPLARAGGGLADRLPDRGRAAGGGRRPGGAEEWGVWVGGSRVNAHPTLAKEGEVPDQVCCRRSHAHGLETVVKFLWRFLQS